MGDTRTNLNKFFSFRLEETAYHELMEEDDVPFQYHKHQLPVVFTRKHMIDQQDKTQTIRSRQDLSNKNNDISGENLLNSTNSDQVRLPMIILDKNVCSDHNRVVTKRKTKKRKYVAQCKLDTKLKIKSRQSNDKLCLPSICRAETMEGHFMLNSGIRRDLHLPSIAHAQQKAKCVDISEECSETRNVSSKIGTKCFTESVNVVNKKTAHLGEMEECMEDIMNKYSTKSDEDNFNPQSKLNQKTKGLVKILSADKVNNILKGPKPMKMEDHHYFWP